MTLVAVATAVVYASLWSLDRLEVLPAGRLQTHLSKPFLVIAVVAMFATPAAWEAGFGWFVEQKTDEMLDRIGPALDNFTPGATVP